MRLSAAKHRILPISAFAALVNIVLLCAPLILAGKLQRIVVDTQIILFLLIVTVWCLMEIMFHPTRTVHLAKKTKWLPATTGATVLVVFWVSLLERTFRHNSTISSYAIGGILLSAIGVILRYFSIRTLGPYFLNEVTLSPEHPLVTHGIYGLMRHPSETGMLSIVFGSSLLLGSLFGTVLCVCALVPIVIRRIRLKDQMLRNHYSAAFSSYARRHSLKVG